MNSDVYIGVGANLEPEDSILRALALLQQQVQVKATSTFYSTPALGCPEQPAYYNGVWQICTRIPARKLKFEVLRGIEAQLGRQRVADKYASRRIDLDLLLYGDLVIEEADFCLPDPDICSRNFIALPLAELAPGLILPRSGQSLAEVLFLPDWSGMTCLPEFTSLLQSRLVAHDPAAW